MAKVILAGYNIDIKLISLLKSVLNENTDSIDIPSLNTMGLKPESISPETLSAAYARISRSPKTVPELRKEALVEVEKSRKSNRTIIFDLGHSSVAEHAVFNFDVLGLSRFAVEFLERFRLASFTEKSQRYVTLRDDFIIPEEIVKAGFKEQFVNLVNEQNALYHELYEKLLPLVKNEHSHLLNTAQGLRTVEGWAKEDARYVISLSTETQLGMTVNARTLEHIIASARSHPLKEIKDLGMDLYEAIKDIAPSIVKYPDATHYLTAMEKLYHSFPPAVNVNSVVKVDIGPARVEILNGSDIDEKDILRVMGFSTENLNYLSVNSEKEQTDYLMRIFRTMKPWDSVPRAFEWIDVKFELELSSSAFAQLKRHRMATIIAQPYEPALGITVPPSIRKAGEESRFIDMVEKVNAFYFEVAEKVPEATSYVLTNSHKRRVLLKMNLRELYHFIRLRADKHAQWDIRNIAVSMADEVKRKLPVITALLGGKDEFDQLQKKLER